MKYKLRILCLLLALSLLLGTGALAVSYDTVSPDGTAAAGVLPVASGCSVELKFQSDDTLLLTYRAARIAAGDQMLLMLVSWLLDRGASRRAPLNTVSEKSSFDLLGDPLFKDEES